MRLAKWKINETAANDGDWIRDLDGFEDFAIHTRSMDCMAAINYQRKLSKQLMGRARTRRDKDIPPEILDYINAKTLIDVCADNWENAILPVDENGAICFDDGKIDGERAFPFSAETLSIVLLEDADDGIVTQPAPGGAAQVFYPKDKKKARYAMRDFLYQLVEAADRVSAPDDKATEKNASDDGSPGIADTPKAPEQKPKAKAPAAN